MENFHISLKEKYIVVEIISIVIWFRNSTGVFRGLSMNFDVIFLTGKSMLNDSEA
jgi:hypothetical protein